MSTKSMVVLIVMVMFCMAGPASASLIGRWQFDEGAGATARDASSLANDGTLMGDAGWDSGVLGDALALDGDGDYVQTTLQDELQAAENFTLSAWFKTNNTSDVQHIVWIGDAGGNGWGANQELHLGINHFSFTNKVSFYYGSGTDTDGQNINIVSREDFTDTALWHHIAGVIENANGPTVTGSLYLDGELVAPLVEDFGFPTTDSTDDVPLRDGWNTGLRIGSPGATQRYFNGLIDDVQIFEVAFTQQQVRNLMTGDVSFPLARGPSPEDGALITSTWIQLMWRPGDFAASHDVYLGDSFEVVNEATRESDEFRGNQTTTFYVAGFPGFAFPDGLVPGTRYYWRIDEVNEADPNSPWKGNIWTFSVAPPTAYNPDPPDGTEFVGPENVTLSWTPGFGAKLHTVYLGDDYDQVNNATGGAPTGTATYSPGALEREKVYYWRVDEFDGAATHKGDIWSFTTPGAVGNPKPSYGAEDVGMNVVLSWTPSDSAASHQLYFGTDKNAVRNADTSSPEYKGPKTLGDESHIPGLLDANTTYYWRVDEVDAQGNTAKGPLWIFTTSTFLLIDDFESYTDNDAEGEAIWQTWVDGFGVADNGAQVGYLLPPYAEQTIVHGGLQSMPLVYTNEAGVTNSEASLTLTAPRNWTQAGVASLSLWLKGSSANAADPVYVSIANTTGAPAIAANDDLNAAQTSRWTQWSIPLQAFTDEGINLSNVDKIAIGLGTKSGVSGPGGTGTLFIDDIRLYLP